MVCVLSSNITNTTSRVASSQSLQALTLAVAGNVEFFLKDQIISLTNSLVRKSFTTVVIFNYAKTTTEYQSIKIDSRVACTPSLASCHDPIRSSESAYAKPLASIQHASLSACLTAAKLAKGAFLRLFNIGLLKMASKIATSYALCSDRCLGRFGYR